MHYPSGTPRWRRYLTFWRRDVGADVDDELRFHFESRVEELVEQGVAPNAAREQAEREFGAVEPVRQNLVAIGARMARRRGRAEAWRDVLGDASYAVRSLRGSPGFTAAVLVTLALGVGVNTAMFALLDAIFLRPPTGVVAPNGVRRVWAERKYTTGTQYSEVMSYQEYQAIADAVDSRARATVYAVPRPAKLGLGEGASEVRLSYAPASYFSVLGVRAERGRLYSGDEDAVSAQAPVAVVSNAYWRRALNGDPAAIGKSLVLDGATYTVIGVSGADFVGTELDAADIWIPLGNYGRFRLGDGRTPWWRDSRINGLFVLVRPAAGVMDAELEQRIGAALRRVGYRWDADARGALGSIIAADGPGTKSQEQQIAVRLAGVAAIVLLIACANVVNLLLSRTMRRRREIAVRLALGIPRARLMRLLLAESAALAVAAAGISILVGYWGGMAMRTVLLPGVHWSGSPMGWPLAAFAVGVSLAAGLAAGLVPGLQSARSDLTSALKSGGAAAGAQRSRLRTGLVVVQAALSMILLVGAALFVRSLSNVRGLDLGFDAARLLTVGVDYDVRRDPDASSGQRLAAVADRAAHIRGVERVALAWSRPMYSFSWISYFSGADSLGSRENWMPTVTTVSPGYFAAAGLRLVRGQDFTRGGEPGVIVNETMAKGLWPGVDALGQCIRFGERTAPCFRVIGVVEDGRRTRVIEDAMPQYYLSFDNLPPSAAKEFGVPNYVVVRADPARVASVTSELRSLVHAEFPGGIPQITRLSDFLEPQYRPWRLGATLFSAFGVLALIVALVGTYSTVSYHVTQRLHEFGVRIALGATVGDVLRLVVSRGVGTVAVGVVVGTGLALAAGKLVATLLFGVTPADPLAFGVVAVALLAMGALAATVPALRAARVDPVTALRAD